MIVLLSTSKVVVLRAGLDVGFIVRQPTQPQVYDDHPPISMEQRFAILLVFRAVDIHTDMSRDCGELENKPEVMLISRYLSGPASNQ
jgi:hypothetical protein|tara:strand:- start:24708 stop:24968 length:261 start_codon:yes stop_codon:yes gene_type:complete